MALALKYRPRVLSEVVGQDIIASQLNGIFQTGDYHQMSFLIHGPYGTGKTSLARLIAKYINCENQKPIPGYKIGEPCGKCNPCVTVGTEACIDTTELDNADDRGVGMVRDIKEKAKYLPDGNARIYIMDEIHQLTPAAFQAMLKLLEEPPKHSIFILCTTDPGKIPNTILSRLSQLRVVEVDVDECTSLLARISKEEGFNVPVESLRKISIITRAHPRNAITTLESVLNVLRVQPAKAAQDIDFVVQTVEDIVGESPDVVAIKFLIHSYKNDAIGAIKALRMAQNHTVFLDTLLRYHEHALYWVVSGNLDHKIGVVDPYMADFFAKLKKSGVYNTEHSFAAEAKKGSNEVLMQKKRMAAILEMICTACATARQWTVETRYVVLSLAMKICEHE